jgi:hypothetical protein
MKNVVGRRPMLDEIYLSDPGASTPGPSYFIVAVLGFSFWFFMAVPFASHRESYGWLANVHNHDFSSAFSVGLASTYRPLHQATAWLGFAILNPNVFPTSALRQTLLQGFVYAMFVLAWWSIYRAASQRRVFALVACITGGVFFSGYVHLFHIYGTSYIPVMLTLGALLYFNASRILDQREVWFAFVAIALVLWHPFVTALFLGFYFGLYLETFDRRGRAQQVQAIGILSVTAAAIGILIVAFPYLSPNVPALLVQTAARPLQTRLFGFLVSYRTNEVNHAASLVAFLLAQMAVFSMRLSPRLKLVACLFVSVLSVIFVLKGLPLLLLWIAAILIKLFRLSRWSLFFLALTATLLPLGGGIGTPIYGLFAIIVAAYVTAMDWPQAEEALSCLKQRYVTAPIIAAALVVLMVRAGVNVPIVTRAASPLLTERERTYQLEDILAWLHKSEYCGYDIAFAEKAGNPIDSVDSALTRRNRPPSGIEDVNDFWNGVLRCKSEQPSDSDTAIVTFGEPGPSDSRPVFRVAGKYAGDATVWIEKSQNSELFLSPSSYQRPQAAKQ